MKAGEHQSFKQRCCGSSLTMHNPFVKFIVLIQTEMSNDLNGIFNCLCSNKLTLNIVKRERN